MQTSCNDYCRLHRKQRKRLLAEERKRQHKHFGPRPKILQSSQPRGIAERANAITAVVAAQDDAGNQLKAFKQCARMST